MRIDRLDKLDKIHYYNTLHSNLLKWWSVNMVGMDNPAEEANATAYDPDAAAEELLADALGYGTDPNYTRNTGKNGSNEQDLRIPTAEEAFGENSGLDPEAAKAAMEIFNRLQAEAAADEAAKKAEIEAAMRAANG